MCGAELQALPESVQRVAAVLRAHGHDEPPVMLDRAARTAQEAADALGVALGQIAKSIVFRRKGPAPGEASAVLVVTAGDRRVDEAAVQALACGPGQKLGRADAEFVRHHTGFAIGGVAPLAHRQPGVVLLDRSLFRFAGIWAAAGHPNAVFRVTPEALARMAGAPVHDVAAAA